ncbi:MAG: serine hydrolase domain-containing protein [Bacteroidota bacterium]|nr:serine hydrolase domain-containing protein [Bacteroidota bacterium]
MTRNPTFILFLLLLLLLYQCTISYRVKKNPEKLIHGYVKSGFEEVKDAFINNFTERGEYGAACAIYYKGEKVVDFWGGYKNSITKEPWEEDTKVIVFSTTKGLAAMSLAIAHSKGWLDYNKKVSTYWPEFAQNGKEDITVKQLLAHEAGLCLVDEKFEITDLQNFDYIAEIMARQKPLWEPGEKHGYHLATMGMYMNELMRRVDPMNRSIGQFFAEEIATPLDLNFYIGLPDAVPDEEIATVIIPSAWQVITNYEEIPKKMRKDFRKPNSILYQSFRIPEKFNPNSRTTLSVEMPSANGVGDARSIAKVYSEFALGAKELGLNRNTYDLLKKDAVVPPAGAFDIVMGLDAYFSFGFLKPGPDLMFGSSRKAFGTPGAGGSFGFADPDKEIGYAYIMTKMGAYLVNDPREMALRNAMYRCIEKLEK